MQYLMMRPEQIREAAAKQVPVVICAGSVEYHGPHTPIGTDTLIAHAVIERVEKECECIVMPPLPFSPTSFWAAGPEDGEFNISGDALEMYAYEIFKGLLAIGFRRIYVLQHHQDKNGFPWLSISKAAQKAVLEICSAHRNSWDRIDDYPTQNIFSCIKIHMLDDFIPYKENQERCPVGHGGKGETQLIMGQYPETIDMNRLQYFQEKDLPYPKWLEDAHFATREGGGYWLDLCAKGWVAEFSKPYIIVQKPTDKALY